MINRSNSGSRRVERSIDSSGDSGMLENIVQVPQVALGMIGPRIVLARSRDAVVRPFVPLFRFGQRSQQGVFDRLVIQRIDQQSVLAIGNDVARPAVVGGHDRQPGGARFQQRQSERFGQRRVDEHASRRRRPGDTDPARRRAMCVFG